MPKAYQISQYDEPLNVDGWLVLADGTRVGIERAHLEEDTGKSTHVGGSGGRIHGSGHSLIDFNRAGVPLVEIVEPARHPHVRAGARVRQRAAGDPRRDRCVGRQDGRGVDARRRQRQRAHSRATPLGTRCEIKNLNSVRSLGRAIEYEARRQIAHRRGRRGGPPGDAGTGTRPTVARTRCARRRTPTTTGTSSSPTSCRSTPTRQWIERVRSGAADAPRRATPSGSPPPPAQPPTARP